MLNTHQQDEGKAPCSTFAYTYTHHIVGCPLCISSREHSRRHTNTTQETLNTSGWYVPPLYLLHSFTNPHQLDIHILLNTIYNPSILHSPASTSCIPICLPKFNPSGFMNAYISFLRKPEGVPTSTDAPNNSMASSRPHSPDLPAGDHVSAPVLFPSIDSSDRDNSTLALVCLNGVGEFDTIKGWCESVSQVSR